MKKILAAFLAAVLFLDVVCIGVLFFTRDTDANKNSEDSVFSRAKILAVGNNITSEEIHKQAKSAGNVKDYDYSFIYENLREKIYSADSAILCQESIISKDHAVAGYPLYNSPEILGEQLLNVGFDVINLANNHILDYGESGLKNTLDFWKSKRAITVGAGEIADKTTPVVQEINGIRLAYIAFTESTNNYSLPENSEYYVNLATSENELFELVSVARQSVEIVIVLAHWGNEYETEVTQSQRLLAQKLGEWGADIIIGTHPHVLQETQTIKNPDGSTTFVAYSLGNFVSSQTKGELMLGGILEFEAVKNKNTGAVSVENIRINGVVTHYGLNTSKIRLYLLSDYTEELANAHGVKRRTKEFSVKYLHNLLSETIDKQYIR